MKHIKILKNSIQEYAWGSFVSIPDLVGMKKPSKVPMAEMWMGAHPKAPSMVKIDDTWVPLDRAIEQFPNEILGKEIAKKFKNRLPYLLKVLAAAKPLSIQAHPDKKQAEKGFEMENRTGIPISAPNRNFRDANHKPECICALTDFWGLCGFRKVDQIIFYLEKVSPDLLKSRLANLFKKPGAEGLKEFFRALLTMSEEERKEVVNDAVQRARVLSHKNPVFEWMTKLYKEYPNDIGVLSPAILNLVCLKPGQAMFLDAGELHAYLDGTGIELMANSDNVLRGGLTPKHVDVEALIKVLKFEEKEPDILTTVSIDTFEKLYSTSADEFLLSVISIKKGEKYKAKNTRNVEILLCIQGSSVISNGGKDERILLNKGVSLLIPAAAHAYIIEGEATIYKATI